MYLLVLAAPHITLCNVHFTHDSQSNENFFKTCSGSPPNLLVSCLTYCAADYTQSIFKVVPHLLQHTGIQVCQSSWQRNVNQTV